MIMASKMDAHAFDVQVDCELRGDPLSFLVVYVLVRRHMMKPHYSISCMYG